MAIQNPSFDTPGAHPGEAEHWTLVTHVARERSMGVGPVPERGVEDFERWVELLRAFEDSRMVRSFFDFAPEGYENFEEGWNNDTFLKELPTGHVLACSFGGEGHDDMSSGWLSLPFARSWNDVSAEQTVFNGDPTESFEEHWRSNEDFAREWSEVTSTQMTFDETAKSVESFKSGWPLANTI